MPALLFILCRAAKNEPRKRAQAFPLGTPCACRSTKIKTRKTDILIPYLSPQSQHERQVKKAKAFWLEI